MMDDDCVSSDDETYEEPNEEILDILCIFCSIHFNTFDSIFAHIQADHGLDLLAALKSHHLDIYSYIKVINYIRKNEVAPSKVSEILESKVYDSDTFLKSVLENDGLLMFGKNRWYVW